MNREEEQKYQRKIEDLHTQVEKAAQELSEIESTKQQAIQDCEKARKEKESLETQISALKAEIETLNNQVSAKQAAQEKRIASQNIKRSKIEKNIKSLQSKLSRITDDIQKKKVFVKDLSALEKKHSKAFTSYKKLLSDSEKAKNDLVKARKQTKQVLDLSAKIFQRAKQREAEAQAKQDAVGEARKTLLFYVQRINKWNLSRNLKPIEIQL